MMPGRRRMGPLLLALALLSSQCAGQGDWVCAPLCTCLWFSGKRTVDCKNKSLTEVPGQLSKETQYLDLSSNYITHLADKAFTRVELDNLQKLVLRGCNIKSVSEAAFHGLKIVIEIDLSNNRIRQLHRGTFGDTERLRVLLLNQNRLQRLEDELFHDLAYLQKVELSDNHLTQVGQWTFRDLPGLQTLTLDGNNLTRLSKRSFEGLPKLGSLELRKNPWQCDCQLRPFRDWAIQRKLYTRPTACELPAQLAGRMWVEIPSEEFACAPSIEAAGALQRGDSGSAQLWCRVAATPPAEVSWVHRQRVLANGTRRGERGYVLRRSGEWANLTIPELQPADQGEYICLARNFGGSAERNVSLLVVGEGAGAARHSPVGLPLALGLGLLALLFLLVALALCLCYCRRRRSRRDEKSAEAASLDHHGLGEQEKSLITAINPVVKPPRRYEAPSVASHGTEMTELNRTLLDNDSVFADGVGSVVGSVVGVLANGLHDEQRGRATPELESLMQGIAERGAVGLLSGGLASANHHGGSVISGIGTLSRNATPYRQYPPDLLAFSAGRNASPTSQASTAPDSSRLSHQGFGSPAAAATSTIIYGTIGFKTLPHPHARAASATPYSMGHHRPSLPRIAYGTMPRRPRAPSWSSGPPVSPTERELPEPVYDNLGARTTADGSSVASLNKSPEPGASMRNRPLPATPRQSASSTPPRPHHQPRLLHSPSAATAAALTLPRAPRSSPLRKQLNRSAPEGAPDEQQQQQQRRKPDEGDVEGEREQQQQPEQESSARKVPPRPPPKPKKRSANGPLYEDEGEDGTEV